MASVNGISVVDNLIGMGYKALKSKDGVSVFRRVKEVPSVHWGPEVTTDYAVVRCGEVIKTCSRNVCGRTGTTNWQISDFVAGREKSARFHEYGDGSFMVSKDETSGSLQPVGNGLVLIPKTREIRTNTVFVDSDCRVKSAHSSIERGRENGVAYQPDFPFPGYEIVKEHFKSFENPSERPKFTAFSKTLTDKNVFA